MSDVGLIAAPPAKVEQTADAALDRRSAWRTWMRQLARGEASSSLRVGIAGSFTVEALVPHLGGAMLGYGLTPEIFLAPYNQLFQVCLNSCEEFGREVDCVLILFRLDDLVPVELDAWLRGERAALDRARSVIIQLTDALRSLRQQHRGTIFVSLPPVPDRQSYTSLDLGVTRLVTRFHAELVSTFEDEAVAIGGVNLVDLEEPLRECGTAAALDARKWYLYKQPYTERFLGTLGLHLARTLRAAFVPAKKCIVVDCDNTLWGGIIGEDGVDGIQLGADFPGSAFRDFQNLLLHWRSRGALLAAVSKNNAEDVGLVFESHDGMVLKSEHFSAWGIDWRPKAEHIPRIAKALNIASDSFVFIDDNRFEIAQMQELRPEVICVQLPEDPAEILPVMANLPWFDRIEVTKEDRTRADMLRHEQERLRASSTMTEADFLRSLDLELSVFRAEPAHLERIAQLINKTNQFNLTTRRRTLDEVRAVARSEEYRLFALRVRDRFGDYGLVGVAVLQLRVEGSALLDTFLMSCRVLGRQIESGFMSTIGMLATESGVLKFLGRYLPTAKNQLVANLLPSLGFSKLNETDWVIDLAALPQLSPHLKVEARG